MQQFLVHLISLLYTAARMLPSNHFNCCWHFRIHNSIERELMYLGTLTSNYRGNSAYAASLLGVYTWSARSEARLCRCSLKLTGWIQGSLGKALAFPSSLISPSECQALAQCLIWQSLCMRTFYNSLLCLCMAAHIWQPQIGVRVT